MEILQCRADRLDEILVKRKLKLRGKGLEVLEQIQLAILHLDKAVVLLLVGVEHFGEFDGLDDVGVIERPEQFELALEIFQFGIRVGAGESEDF